MEKFDVLYNRWKRTPGALSKGELEYLYNTAKSAYYNGEELMPDSDFDSIEAQQGKENKGYVGSKTGNYTEKHSFIMGSLSKVQVKEDKRTGEVNWESSAEGISSYLKKARASIYETTPKLDGCSFSAEFKNVNGEAVLTSCATRGDGEYGTDISHWFESVVRGSDWDGIDDCVAALCEENSDDIFCVRGEVLIPHSSFGEKYQETFTNPRSFVAGCLGQKWEDTREQKSMSGDLHFVCYDYRLVDGDTGRFTEIDWINPADKTYSMIKKYLHHVGELPDMDYCQVHMFNGEITVDELQEIYDEYDEFRGNISKYALDGVVFKPSASDRIYNDKRARPTDCVAMKFMPMMNSTKIIDIKWTVGKTGEYSPIAIIDTIKLDGKNINKASLHNYNYIVAHDAGIGAEVRISLAGDIIPFVYEIVTPAEGENYNLPEDGYVYTDPKSGNMHLMKRFTDEGLLRNQFMASAKALGINYIGPAAAGMLWDALSEVIPEECPEVGDVLNNVIQLIPESTHGAIIRTLGGSKSTRNIISSLTEYGERMELADVIKSFCFKNCGDRASNLCAKLLSGINASTASFPADSYAWATNPESPEYRQVMNMASLLGIDMLSADEGAGEAKIPVIMTGSPKEVSPYATKEAFLNAHPQYVETTSWKECKILFTDDLESTSGKMKKAQKAGVEIRLYEE